MKFSEALYFVKSNAEAHAGKAPTLGTLMEEVAELTRSLEGKHEDAPPLELVQIAGIALNWLTNYGYDETFYALSARERHKASEAVSL